MRDLRLTFSPSLLLASLTLLAACDSPQMTALDLSVYAFLEQPGGEVEQVVHLAFQREGTYARRSLKFPVWLESRLTESVEQVSVGDLVPENEGDGFTADQRINVAFGLSGSLRLAPCSNGESCTSMFSFVVSSNSSAPGEIELSLLGGFSVDDTWRGSFEPEMWVEP